MNGFDVENWGKECDAQTGLCFNSSRTNYCTGQQPCSGGGVGDMGIKDMTIAEIAASDTKFWGTYTKAGNLKLISVGMLKSAGLKPGDELVSVEGFSMTIAAERRDVLQWEFQSEKVRVKYLRDGKELESIMLNPQFK